jgi:hypothetical protein
MCLHYYTRDIFDTQLYQSLSQAHYGWYVMLVSMRRKPWPKTSYIKHGYELVEGAKQGAWLSHTCGFTKVRPAMVGIGKPCAMCLLSPGTMKICRVVGVRHMLMLLRVDTCCQRYPPSPFHPLSGTLQSRFMVV